MPGLLDTVVGRMLLGHSASYIQYMSAMSNRLVTLRRHTTDVHASH